MHYNLDYTVSGLEFKSLYKTTRNIPGWLRTSEINCIYETKNLKNLYAWAQSVSRYKQVILVFGQRKKMNKVEGKGGGGGECIQVEP